MIRETAEIDRPGSVVKAALLFLGSMFLIGCVRPPVIEMPETQPAVSTLEVEDSARQTGEAIREVEGRSARVRQEIARVEREACEDRSHARDLEARLEEVSAKGEADAWQLAELGGMIRALLDDQLETEEAAKQASEEADKLRSQVTKARSADETLRGSVAVLASDVEAKNSEAEKLRVGMRSALDAERAARSDADRERGVVSLLWKVIVGLAVLVLILGAAIWAKVKLGSFTGGIIR